MGGGGGLEIIDRALEGDKADKIKLSTPKQSISKLQQSDEQNR